MRVSVTKSKSRKSRAPRRNSRYDQLVDAVDDLGMDGIFEVELWAREGIGAGRFAYIDTNIQFLGAKGTDADLDLQTPQDVVDRLFALALDYEDENGPQTFQAHLFPKENDGGKGKTPVKRTFRTVDDPSLADEREDASVDAIRELSKTVGSFQRTTSAVLKDLRETAEHMARHGPGPEHVAAAATAKVELRKLELEHQYDDRVLDIADARLDQLISEIAPGVREAIRTEPTRNTLPERLRKVMEQLDPTQMEQLRDVLGGPDGVFWRTLGEAARCATNVDFRSVMEDFQAHYTPMSTKEKKHLERELLRVLPPEILKQFVKVLQSGGIA